jgi:Ca2+-binding EF-hand superfamily protein
MTQKSTVNALPKLPGYNFEPQLTQPVTHGKTCSFTFVKGMPVVKQIDTNRSNTLLATNTVSDEAIFAKHKGWNTLTGKVLRFFGYFTEKVAESAIEKFRVRKVVVLFYLQDRTLTVNEAPTVQNHGMRAGCLMSRHSEKGVDIENLAIGNCISLRGRDITLVDCDEATRTFYNTMGLPQTEGLDYPPDAFEAVQNPVKRQMDLDHAMMKQAVEALAAAASGKHSTRLTPEERTKAQLFFHHDREVLNFNATWEQRNFRVNFFLADGTMQISQVRSTNDGRDPVAAFVKRGLIPKSQLTLKAIDTISAPRNAVVQYFTALDLRTGQTIKLFEREFYIYDCDPFTRNYYKAVHGIDQDPVEKPWTEGDPPEHPLRQPTIPPYNGFGTDEDSLGSFKHMVPKPPKKDYGKYIRHANDVLRFSGELSNPKAEDSGRQFIVCYYLADDTVSIFEYSIRNSGHVGGKIFARAKVPGVTQDHFYVGAQLKLAGWDFTLLEMDERTANFLETGLSMGKLNDEHAEELLAKLRKVLQQRYLRVTDAYRHFNRSKSGIGIEDLAVMLDECEVKVDSKDTIAHVMQLADLDKDGVISLQEFVENVLKQALVKTEPKDAPVMDAKSYAAAQQLKSDREFADKVHKLFVAKLEARRAFIVDTFRIVSDRAIDGLIGVETFKSVVQDRLGLNLSHEELDALVFKFFYVDQMPDWKSRRLSLREFRKVLDA